MSDVWKWAFDGVGGGVVVLFLGWLLDRYRRRSKKIADAKREERRGFDPYYKSEPFPPIPENTKLTKPSPDEIRDQINSLPPFQRRSAARAYHGLEVCWQGLFQHVEERPLGGVVITVKCYNPINYSAERISCDGVLTPKLRISKENEPLIIRGTIASVAGALGFWLKDANIEFLDSL